MENLSDIERLARRNAGQCDEIRGELAIGKISATGRRSAADDVIVAEQHGAANE
jgi:hypothetical protein